MSFWAVPYPHQCLWRDYNFRFEHQRTRYWARTAPCSFVSNEISKWSDTNAIIVDMHIALQSAVWWLKLHYVDTWFTWHSFYSCCTRSLQAVKKQHIIRNVSNDIVFVSEQCDFIYTLHIHLRYQLNYNFWVDIWLLFVQRKYVLSSIETYYLIKIIIIKIRHNLKQMAFKMLNNK